MVAELEEICLVEFKGPRELSLDLVDTVEPLEKDGTALVDVRVIFGVSVALGELVAEHEPVVLDKDAKAVDGAVEGVQHEFSERKDLRGAVPAVTAMDEYRLGLAVDTVGDGTGGFDDT